LKNALYELINNELSRAVVEKEHAWKVFTFANTNQNNEPVARSVILRSYEFNQVSFFTDFRSDKIEALKNNHTVSLCFYSNLLKLQLQIKAKAIIYHKDNLCKEQWDSTYWTSLLCYHMQRKPSTVLDEPFLLNAENMSKDEAYKNFAVIVCKSIEWDVLELKEKGNQRSKFTFDMGGSFNKAQFLAP